MQKTLSTVLILLLGSSGLLLANILFNTNSEGIAPSGAELGGLVPGFQQLGYSLVFVALTVFAVWFNIRNWKKATNITVAILLSLVCMYILWIVKAS